jgi:hypothetical protein
VLDSGCTQHMTGDIRMFTEMSEEGCSTYDSITFGDNRKGKVKGLGKVIMASPRRPGEARVGASRSPCLR